MMANFQMFAMLLWALWNQRNERLWEQKSICLFEQETYSMSCLYTIKEVLKFQQLLFVLFQGVLKPNEGEAAWGLLRVMD